MTELGAMSHSRASSTVVVGIPCYNEEVAIGSLVLRASQYADQVVVLDDGSTDKTAEVARFAGARVLVHEVNMGKGAALRDLFQYATQSGFGIIVIIDGDGQHNPDDIPKLVGPLLRDEADIINGSRDLSGGAGSTPRYRRFGQMVLDKVIHFGLSDDVTITDTQSGFQVQRRQADDRQRDDYGRGKCAAANKGSGRRGSLRCGALIYAPGKSRATSAHGRAAQHRVQQAAARVHRSRVDPRRRCGRTRRVRHSSLFHRRARRLGSDAADAASHGSRDVFSVYGDHPPLRVCAR